MRFEDTGIVISIKKFQERKLLYKIYTAQHGLVAGMVGKTKNNPQIFSNVKLHYNSRLDEHLGMLKLDIIKSYEANIYSSKLLLYSLNLISELINIFFKEKDPHPRIYNEILELLNTQDNSSPPLGRGNESLRHLQDGKLDEWGGFNNADNVTPTPNPSLREGNLLHNSLILYLNFLSDIGYGLDLTSCVYSGSDDVYYLSPKTGKAACKQYGDVHADKLFVIPQFLLGNTQLDKQQAINTLNIFENFISNALLHLGIEHKFDSLDKLKNLISA